jgi:hypothetical protein
LNDINPEKKASFGGYAFAEDEQRSIQFIWYLFLTFTLQSTLLTLFSNHQSSKQLSN